MKKTIITLLALAGVAAAAEVLTLDLSALNSPGTLIGGDSSTALTTSSAFDNTTNYATLTGLFTETGKWYASYGYNNNINTSTGNGVPSSGLGAVLVAGGPVQNGRSTIGGIEFTLTAAQLAQFDGPLTLSFEVAHHYGNDNKNHQISFYLLTGAVTLTSEIYNSKSGSNLLEESSVAQSPFSTVSLAYTADQVDAMKATGEDQTFAFVAYTDAINGSNTGFVMKNFQMSGFAAPAVPEPTTATLSLLALAGLAARRRRK